MAISVESINESQKHRLLSEQEGHFLDLKAIDIKPSKLTRTISAFANADGGELYIGIDEETRTGVRSWRGFTRMENANGHLQAFDQLFPLGQDFSYVFLTCANSVGYVLKAEVRKTTGVQSASN